MPKNQIAAIVLAAGRSSRMGAAKQLLPFGKTTLLGAVIENTLTSKVNDVFCVLGAEAVSIIPTLEKYHIEILKNENYEAGLSSSIMKAVKRIIDKDFDAVLIVLGDQPLVTPEYLNALLDSHKKDKDAIIATDYGSAYGVPVVIPKKHYPDLLALKGDKGAKEFLNSPSQKLVGLKCDSLFDVDTKEDYLELIKQIQRSE